MNSPFEEKPAYADEMRLADLLRKREALDAEIAQAREAETAHAVAACKRYIASYGLTAFDLGLVPAQKIKGRKVKAGDKTFPAKAMRASAPPRYRNPETGDTWSGRGKPPKWIGESRDEFLIAHQEETS